MKEIHLLSKKERGFFFKTASDIKKMPLEIIEKDYWVVWVLERLFSNEGEFFIVPKGTDHLPYSESEAHVLLFEPKQVINTGNIKSEKTVEKLEWL